MKRPPELFEFLKPSARSSEERVVRRSLKYWRLPAREGEVPKAATAESEKSEKRRSKPKRPTVARKEPPAPPTTTKRAAGRFVLSRGMLGIAAGLFVALIGLGYVVGHGGLFTKHNPPLSMNTVGEAVWTVQVIHWDGIGQTQDQQALSVMEFLRTNDQFKSLGLEPSAVQVRGAEETRVYVGRATRPDDPALESLLEKLRPCVFRYKKVESHPFEFARVRMWTDTTKS